MLEELIERFRKAGVAIQLTIEIGKKPTVHAFDYDRVLHLTEGETPLEALQKMEDKLLENGDELV